MNPDPMLPQVPVFLHAMVWSYLSIWHQQRWFSRFVITMQQNAAVYILVVPEHVV